MHIRRASKNKIRHFEGPPRRRAGLGLLPVRTVLTGKKTTRQVEFRFAESGACGRGYEIHMGRTCPDDGTAARHLACLADGTPEGCRLDRKCWGTYLHGILDNNAVVDYLLEPYAQGTGNGTAEDYTAFKERQYDLLAAHVRRHLDMEALYRILSSEKG